MTSLSPDRWTQIKDIFFRALELTGIEQTQLIDGLANGDADLAAEVRRLIQLSDNAGNFLETPVLLSSSLFSPRDRVADRYRVIRLIGQGGMADVYEAHDEAIGEPVALKVARPGQESLEALASRWRREVSLARKVTHAGVCRVHDVAVHDQDGHQRLVLTMELLSGPSLRARLEANDLTTAESVAVARGIGSALDASHDSGVLHRDIKPDNILFDRASDGRVRAVLTDFGLARGTTPGRAAVTRSGVIAGTLGYMAPEILRGQPPSRASDLFAFATVIREMLASAAVAPSRVSHIFNRALNADPAERYVTAAALVDAVEGALRPRRRPTRVAVATVTSATLVALAWGAFRYYQQPPRVAVASEVLLTSMLNGTTDREFDGVTEVFRSQLAQSPHFEILSSARVTSSLANMGRSIADLGTPEIAREVAMREGVPLVVFSTLSRLAQDYSVSIKLERVGVRPTLTRATWTQTFTTSSKAGLFETLRDAATWVRRMAGETEATIEEQDLPASETTTSSWDALQLYTRAMALAAAGRDNDSTLLLEAAIRSDPEFAMAHMQLGDRLIALKRDKQGYRSWLNAIALLERKQLTSRETLRIRGQYFDDTGDLIEAEKAYRIYAAHYPHDFQSAFLLGATLVELDRAPEGVGWLETAHRLRPTSLTGLSHLTLTYLDLGRGPDAARMIAELDRLGFRDWATWYRALSLFMTGDVRRALGSLEPLRTSTDREWRSRVSTIRASWLSELGRDADALKELKAGIAFDEGAGFRDRVADKWLHVAELERRQQDPAAVASAHRAIETASSLRRVVNAATLLFQAGDRRGAEKLASSLDDFPQVARTQAAGAKLDGLRRLEKGDAESAVMAFERAFAVARRRESRLPLARALIRNGEFARAEQLLASIVAHPAAIYAGPEPQAPGLWRETVAELISLTARRDPSAAEQLRQRYASLAPPASAPR